MKIIIVDEKHGASRSVVLRGWLRLGLSLCLLGLPVVLGYYGFQLAQSLSAETQRDEAAQAWVDGLREQKADLERVKHETLAQLEALTIRMASLQARLIRLDALGERLTNAAGLDDGEFDFTQEPSVGGPEVLLEDYGKEYGRVQMPDFLQQLDELTNQIESRQQQLELLDSILIERQNQSEFSLSGRPVNKGYISSGFGRRIDPFTGNLAYHQGVDFSTGRVGEEVFAVAAGVVKFSGEKQGFGKMVQLDHGNGFETIYAHDQKVLVKVGD
ncbi:MAG: peptidoglycan DD-metalloendopeptidase family protein, partial [Pseudomonadota bacterium]|nr:peptidoglycan DD-metalloendopeptidase family protein [Pseudomonadota bacterium]